MADYMVANCGNQKLFQYKNVNKNMRVHSFNTHDAPAI